MYTVNDLLPSNKLDDPDAIEARVRSAYLAWADGRCSKADFDLIMVDLAQQSGYLETLPATASPGEFADHNGARRVFGRIMLVLGTPAEYLKELSDALQRTPVLTTEQE